MPKLYKYILLVFSVFLMTGCLFRFSPSERVEAMLNKYIKNDKDLMDELDTYLDEQNLTEEQRKRYKNIIKNEYSNIKYEIINESIEDNNATVEVSINVIDLFKANEIAENALLDNPENFYTDKKYDANKFIDYKLSVMESNKDTVGYTIYINLIKRDNTWQIDNIDNETLEKIHGIYNYRDSE